MMFWGIAALYVLSGLVTTLLAFGAIHVGIDTASTTMQILAALGIVSIIFVRIVAGKLAKPIFEAHAIAQSDRNVFHGLWMALWLLGFMTGSLPIFIW